MPDLRDARARRYGPTLVRNFPLPAENTRKNRVMSDGWGARRGGCRRRCDAEGDVAELHGGSSCLSLSAPRERNALVPPCRPPARDAGGAPFGQPVTDTTGWATRPVAVGTGPDAVAGRPPPCGPGRRHLASPRRVFPARNRGSPTPASAGTTGSALSSSSSTSSASGTRGEWMSYTPGPISSGSGLPRGPEQLHLGPRRLDRDHVGVEARRSASDDVVELAVAHVGVDLRVVAHRPRWRGGKQSTAQARYPARSPRRSGSPSRSAGSSTWIIGDAGLSRSSDFVADGEGDLTAGLAARLVIAHERPLEHRHRPGQHALHRPVGQRLRVAPTSRRSSARAATRRRR